MDCSDSFEIQCPKCGAREQLTFSEMETKEMVQCTACGIVRGMRRDDVLEVCREAARSIRQRLS